MLSSVSISSVSPERFRDLLGDEYAGVEEAIELTGRALAGRAVWHINSTPTGGGVAELLQSLLPYARGAGADVRWSTIHGDEQFFRVTKRIHNMLHGAGGDGGELGSAEREIYDRALAPAAVELSETVRAGDIVYLHDPQTAGLAKSARDAGASVVWRCHIGADKPDEVSRAAWEFLRPYLEPVEAFVFSRPAFVWDGLEGKRVWIVPPSIDVFSPKNQELEPERVAAVLHTLGLTESNGAAPTFVRRDGSHGRVDRPAVIDQDRPLRPGAPQVTQVSRWDRLKDPAGVLRCFAEHCAGSDAELLLVGPAVAGVGDDPEGAEVLGAVREQRLALPPAIRERTHLVSLPTEDTDENATMVNALQRSATVVVQKSLAEGFGLTVSEAMWKGRPVVAGRVGGIQDQIVDGVSGLLVDDPADLEAVGRAICDLLDDPARAEAMGAAARERVTQEFLGSRHLIRYAHLLAEMVDGERQTDGAAAGAAAQAP